MRVLSAAIACTAAFATAPFADACSAVVVWRAELTGADMTPAVQTDARGVASIDFRFGHPQATVNVDLQNAKDVTRIDVLAGDFQKPGPILFTLAARRDAPLAGRFARTLTQKDLKRRPAVNVRTFDDALRAVVEGTAYVLVTTKAHKHGELMGRIGMRKDVVFSEADAAGVHDVRLHEQVQSVPPTAP